MSRCVDQVEIVDSAVTRLVLQRGRLGLDGDAALALDVHRIEHLSLHLAIREPPTEVDDAVGQCRLSVVDVGDDGKITDVIHAASKKGRLSSALPCSEDREF